MINLSQALNFNFFISKCFKDRDSSMAKEMQENKSEREFFCKVFFMIQEEDKEIKKISIWFFDQF